MRDELLESVLHSARDLANSLCVSFSVFEFSSRAFVPEASSSFCKNCSLAASGGCDSRTAHTYGCFEAERWNGLYIYYCPMSLAFLATVVFEALRATYALVAGPLVMGSPEDLPALDTAMAKAVQALPERGPEAVNAMARVQWMTAMYLSGRGLKNADTSAKAQTSLHNTLYEVTDQMRSGPGARYPFEVEQRLQKMIIQGDKAGARELINQLLGALYFTSTGDLGEIKQRAKELIVLFSRASIEGGADVQRIFGQNPNLQADIDRTQTLDELSQLLTGVFYRFVGYVFDFSKFQHVDIMHKAVSYLKENLAQRVTLEELAQHVGLSKSYLSTIFKTELGQTFTDYVNWMRIEKSKELLLNPRLSLAAIADLIGYNDQSYFTKKFSQLAGMSPGQYRKKRGQTWEDAQ